MSKKCVLVHVLKEQVNGPVNLNKNALCDTDQYVCWWYNWNSWFWRGINKIIKNKIIYYDLNLVRNK